MIKWTTDMSACLYIPRPYATLTHATAPTTSSLSMIAFTPTYKFVIPVLPCRMQNYTAKLYVLHTSLKLNLPHRLCLWTFLKLSNVLPISESPKNIVNMNYITFDEPIGLFANNFMFHFHFLSYFRQLSLVARGKTHTKSVRVVSLLFVLIISLCTLKYLCGLCGGGFEQAKRYLLKGLSFTFE